MAAEEPTGVRITNREIYDTLLEVKASVAPLPTTVADHEGRIRSLERFAWGYGGIGGVLGSGLTLLIAAVIKT